MLLLVVLLILVRNTQFNTHLTSAVHPISMTTALHCGTAKSIGRPEIDIQTKATRISNLKQLTSSSTAAASVSAHVHTSFSPSSTRLSPRPRSPAPSCSVFLQRHWLRPFIF